MDTVPFTAQGPEYINFDQQTNSEVWNDGVVAVVRRFCKNDE